MKVRPNKNFKYDSEVDNHLVEDALAEEIDMYLRKVYDAFKAVHPEWDGIIAVIGDKNDTTATSKIKVITRELLNEMLEH